jgi:hypothetical protein
MPQQTQPAVDAIRMEPLGKYAQNGVVAGQGRCDEKIRYSGVEILEFHIARGNSLLRRHFW